MPSELPKINESRQTNEIISEFDVIKLSNTLVLIFGNFDIRLVKTWDRLSSVICDKNFSYKSPISVFSKCENTSITSIACSMSSPIMSRISDTIC